MKLKAPTDNEHHAFCTPGCHAAFYRARCLVCEDPMKRKREGQKIKSGHSRCAAEYRKFPRAYDYPRAENAKKGADSQIANESFRNADKMAFESAIADALGPEFIPLCGDPPSQRALRSWMWHVDGDECELRSADGMLLARLESNAGRHRLTYPRTFPILSWADLVEAKHRAESVALAALPLDPATPARVKRDNAMPHPMGAPLSLEVLPVVDSPPIAPAEPFEGDPLEIPQFLRRTAP
jgi:hypothetical protein